ncbi:methyltransferase domain-containing protein [Methylacidiphilum caldifontis]|uniref:class I SAM-dependent methyltransferase n=1 Tax=Methylacidiphilum caldifontis TaxID=2795386 RepID=UPI001A8CB690|nr:class I SAM-dependent methyltransferase [Methylacidiphilum caldifontis]QSR88953.1 methyltransferase domain-containing protein [Methylacidiphilum caldifontis]
MNKNTFAFAFDIEPISNAFNDIRIYHLLKSAFDFDLFRTIGNNHFTVSQLAEKTGSSQRGMMFFLNALTALGFLEKEKETYKLSLLSKQLFLEDSPDYIGDLLQSPFLNEDWEKLTEAIRRGGPLEGVEGQAKAEEFFPKLIRFLHVLHRNVAVKAAQVIGAGTVHNGLHVLDVGCGSAVWSIAIALADSKAQVTAVDFPKVIEHTRSYVQRHGVADRYHYLAGNIEEINYPSKDYDLVILANILHSEGEKKSRVLLKKFSELTTSTSQIAIIEFLPNRQRTSPVEAILFGLRMLINTTEGGIYSAEEFEEWLKEVGFSKISYHDIGSHSPLLLASKN